VEEHAKTPSAGSVGAHETRVNRGEKDLHCPKPLISFVTENGSGSKWGVVTFPMD
jgi:hypothetical protein